MWKKGGKRKKSSWYSIALDLEKEENPFVLIVYFEINLTRLSDFVMVKRIEETHADDIIKYLEKRGNREEVK